MPADLGFVAQRVATSPRVARPPQLDGTDVHLEHEDVRDRHGNCITGEYREQELADILDEDAPVGPHDGRPTEVL
ncbi:MAG: hypothetical protein ACRDSL_08005 [Pseudonocardiaceae bacterium]